ncbi:hypothetical protein LLEC1_05754 [Akanthomyces lecanii]|uniref:Exonuclease domain-containing protein n=1 Tax=Cordyceps confragosa TaxID=2714763 RepID=A0A179ICR8_CORDF|nr:hypothetical protein LLEC1_05754 [Akanthomyces lecanii]
MSASLAMDMLRQQPIQPTLRGRAVPHNARVPPRRARKQLAPPVVAIEVPKKDKPKYPGLSLKALAAERLQRQIQTKGQGHDSLEDALATRDLLLWHMVNKPEPPVFD